MEHLDGPKIGRITVWGEGMPAVPLTVLVWLLNQREMAAPVYGFSKRKPLRGSHTAATLE